MRFMVSHCTEIYTLSTQDALSIWCRMYTTATGLYPLSLHDALPISAPGTPAPRGVHPGPNRSIDWSPRHSRSPCRQEDRKSTRLNSSHLGISYAVFCLKKKKSTRLNSSQQILSHAGSCVNKDKVAKR